MQAILTKILPATNTKPTRIKAICERGAAVMSYPDVDRREDAHKQAVNNLVHRFASEDAKAYGSPYNKNPWFMPYCSGQIASGEMVHVFCEHVKE